MTKVSGPDPAFAASPSSQSSLSRPSGLQSGVVAPSFEKCAETLAGYIIEGKCLPSYARALQRDYGYDEYKLQDRAREIAKADPARFTDLSHEYEVVAEILEYFDSYRLATWAPIAAIIRRERTSLAAAARQGGDVQQAPGEAPQSGLSDSEGNAQKGSA